MRPKTFQKRPEHVRKRIKIIQKASEKHPNHCPVLEMYYESPLTMGDAVMENGKL